MFNGLIILLSLRIHMYLYIYICLVVRRVLRTPPLGVRCRTTESRGRHRPDLPLPGKHQ